MALSRQTLHTRRGDAQRLNALLPSDVLLTVQAAAADEHYAFRICDLRTPCPMLFTGRYEVIHAWISGYLARHNQRTP